MSSQVLPDVLPPGLRLVFCGTQAGRASAQRGAYYAGPGNKFWRTLHEVGLVPQQLDPADFREMPRYGIGFTDVAKATFGPDAGLKRHHFDAESFNEKMTSRPPVFIAFNGKRAAQAIFERPGPAISYGLQSTRIAGAAVFVLPSTSGAAAGFWSIEPWRELASAMKEAGATQ